MKETEISYIAGLIDGEGTITLSRNHPGEFRSPVLSMSNTSQELLDVMTNAFGGSISIQRKTKQHHTQAWNWRVTGRKAIDAIRIILPYLRHPEKKRRAKLIRDTYLSVTSRNGKYSSQLLSAKLKFEDDFFHPSNP